MSYDDADSISYNPFADDDTQSKASSVNQGYYSSAFFPKLVDTSPSLRRRRSSITGQGSTRNLTKRKQYRLQDGMDEPDSPPPHPLKSALLGAHGGCLPDLGITRPSLSRLLGEGTSKIPPPEEDTSRRKPPVHLDEEKDVIVHQISSKDSLAGISLKYGISLANLRRSNQLWTSDSIHLRQVLYIPIELASRAQEYVQKDIVDDDTPGSKTHSPSVSDDMSTYSSTNSEHYSESTPSTSSPPSSVRKIPARQLSFFPPSTKNNDSLTVDRHLEPPPLRNHSAQSSPSGHRYSPTSASHNSLASILTALPIAASTRDEIMTRLSFDSVSSGASDRSRVNSDEYKGHELDNVAKHDASAKPDDFGWDDFDESSMPTPRATTRLPRPQPPRKIDNMLSTSVPKLSHSHSMSSASPPRFYVSQANETLVRTSQLEPSLGMQIPIRRSQTVGRTAGKSVLDDAKRETSKHKPTNGRDADWGLALDTM